ncbi:MAG TPA: nitrile hydratase accessory protein [Acidimicrobiia bacterium]|nr:nitrile hydratase accessory protein [Acidimicrobiia bacterium]
MTLLQLDVEGPAAPPRSNGELVFAAPWESRAFGLAMALHDGGLFEWESFRRQLIAAVARAEAAGGEFSYYRCWLEALQTLLDSSGLVDSASVEELAARLAGRPAGHDHDHDHDH